ncbi:MAG: hypothetical protein JWM47_3673 [Acidimicrobiales bacterium]|nr:hypothetical protein [Acidimicrobiales bacterium]
MKHPLPALAAITVSALLFAPMAACSSETRDKAGDAAKSAKDDAAQGVDAAQARSTAEALRAGLKANHTADAKGMRSVIAIKEVIVGLPGDPDVTGNADADGDGQDDDGKLQANADESKACLSLPAQGEDAQVEDGAC